MAVQQPAVRVVLMAGGKGERLWPKSTQASPKQFLRIVGDKSLLRAAFERLAGLVPTSAIYVVTGAAYRQMTLHELPELPEQNVILEPESRNTAPALGLTALWFEAESPDVVMIGLPSDHYILGERKFRVTLEAAVQAAQHGGIYTLGVPATRPEPGLGYIHVGEAVADYRGLPVHRILQFVEKPDVATAEQFVKSGRYWWNTGMVICQVKVLRQEIARHLPILHGLLEEIRTAARETASLPAAVSARFGSAPNISLDKGVLEKSDQVYVIPAYFEWHDVGNWGELERLRPRDDAGNSIQGDVILHDSRNLFVDADSTRVVAAVGLENVAIVDTDSALLVCAKDRVQEVKRVAELAAPFTHQTLQSALPEGQVVSKPWGWEIWWALTEAYAAKVLEIMAGQSVSQQYLTRKLETLYIQAGYGRLRIGDTWQDARPGLVVTVPPGTPYRLEASSEMTVIAVCTPDQEDVLRLDDRYGRAQEQ